MPGIMEDQYNALFDYLELFTRIPVHDQEVIRENIRFREVPEGHVLLAGGKRAKEFFFIKKGILKIGGTGEKGNPVVLHFLKENQFCTILQSLNHGTVADESIIAACPAELIVFSRDRLFQLYEQFPYFKTLIDQISQQTLLAKIQARNAYQGEDASTRYRKFLLRQPEIALRVPLSDVASYLGITQQSLSRIRRSIR
jgi:CRP-like cAMP-binding protein